MSPLRSPRLPPESRRGAAFGDINNDGNVDVVLVNVGAPPTLLLNQGGNSNHRVLFKLSGTKSNRSAIGARVTVKAGKLVQFSEVRAGGSYISQNDPRLHFGLGTESRMTEVEIRWPSGKVEVLHDVPADFIYTIIEGQGITGKISIAARRRILFLLQHFSQCGLVLVCFLISAIRHHAACGRRADLGPGHGLHLFDRAELLRLALLLRHPNILP